MSDLKAYLHDGLRWQREALLAKLDGLTEQEVRMPRTPTGTNLLGLVKHVACCEAEYFGVTFGRPCPVPMPWDTEGVGEDDNEDMFATETETRESVLEFARRCFDHADATIALLDLDAEGHVPWWPERSNPVTLGRILSHMALDEARHAGHADILREQIDGHVGLRAPGNNLPDWDSERWAAYVARLTRIADDVGDR